MKYGFRLSNWQIEEYDNIQYLQNYMEITTFICCDGNVNW